MLPGCISIYGQMSRLHFSCVLRFEFLYWCKAAESRSFCRHGAFNINKLFNLKVIAYIICSAVQTLRSGVCQYCTCFVLC